ncbi:MAG: DUF4287 domain-containing protein [Eudoraea sp.]|nr:DUF4287 domain-containing protein [Eudoraea sp.]
MNEALKTMISNMPAKTGKSLEEWTAILKSKAFKKHSEAVKFLKEVHGVTHGFANTIVSLSKEDNDQPQDLLLAQYKGKEGLKPIYDKLIAVITKIGNDITISPKKTSVSIIRNKQFALIKPATKTRIDLGLKLRNEPTTKRLEPSGPFGTMCTHRVRLETTKDVDQEIIKWLRAAHAEAL